MSKASTKLSAARLQRLLSGDYTARQVNAELPALGTGTADVLVLAGADPGAMASLALDPDSAIFVPKSMGVRPEDVGGAQILTYEGGPGSDDEEMLLAGGLVVGFQSYISATFVPLTCPTSIQMTDVADYESFHQDADAAVLTGTFADVLVHPLAMLGDLCGLGTEHSCATPTRTRAVVGRDGVCRPSLAGLHFAPGEEPATACSACLGGSVPPADLASARAARPWLSRYLLVLDVLRLAGHRFGGPIEVSGFGHRLSADLDPVPVEAASAPVLLRVGAEHLVCDPPSRRVFRTGADAARILEAVLAGDAGEPVDDVARHLDLSGATAAAALADLQGTLDELGFPLRLAELA